MESQPEQRQPREGFQGRGAKASAAMAGLWVSSELVVPRWYLRWILGDSVALGWGV